MARWFFWIIGLFCTVHPLKTTVRSLFLLEGDSVSQLCGIINQKTNRHEKTLFAYGFCIHGNP